MTPEIATIDSSRLLRQAAEITAADADGTALSRLLGLAGAALGTETLALYRPGLEDALFLHLGEDTPRLRRQAEAGGPEAAVLRSGSDGKTLGVWTAALPDGAGGRWLEVAEALAPFLTIALRQTRWRDEITDAQAQVERRIR